MFVATETINKEKVNKNHSPSSHKHWTPLSWKSFEAKQQPIYENEKKLEICLSQIKNSPALVNTKEIAQLKKSIQRAKEGKEFLLQAGDCAERFSDCHIDIVSEKIHLILTLREIIEKRCLTVVTPIGRIAGQYAKPRTREIETLGSCSIPSFKGDIINSSKFREESRKPNPQLMLTAYKKSAQTLYYIKKIGLNCPFYISHEALLLCYESSMTRQISLSLNSNNNYFNASAHMLWLGERTRDLNGAHVEYLRGVQNPIGIKISSKISNKELVDLVIALNPTQEEGKIVLIPRLGSSYVDTHLPRLIQTVQQTNLNVTWMCDPMHGNGEILQNGMKTRQYKKISEELLKSVRIHKKLRSVLGGLHLEISENDVTECLGGNTQICIQDLEKNYQSACDPRLNPSQSMQLIQEFMEEMLRDH